MSIYLTKEKFEELVKELEYLKTGGRREVARKLQEAREKGDLSENAEYDAAKQEKELLERRIAELERRIAEARIVDPKSIDTSTVQMLCRVRVRNIRTGKEVEYQLVSDMESNTREGKISVNSPVGKALLGRRVGDVVKVRVPAGMIELQILEIKI